MYRRWTAIAIALAALGFVSPQAAQVNELPHPRPRPEFDHTEIDRALGERLYASAKPAYRFFALGPEGKSIIAMVAYESKGTGTRFDMLYVDLDADHNLTDRKTTDVREHDAPTSARRSHRPRCPIASC